MGEDTRSPADLPLLEQAAGWFDRRSVGALSPDEQFEFERWRSLTPAHRLAFAEIETAHAVARTLAGTNEMLTLRHEALSRIVMPANAAAPRVRRWAGIAAAFVAVIAIGGWAALGSWRGSSVQTATAIPTLYHTAVGEQLSIALPDGSNVMLDTASRLRLAYSKDQRLLVLESGQALFRVAKGQQRPFIVRALDRVITAHGTLFDVRIVGTASVKVSLIEGSVSVARAAAPSLPAARLRPDDVLVASNDNVSVTRDPKIEKEVSWRDGLIIFEDDSLAEATAEVNRYVRVPIVLRDDKLRQIRVSGAFRTGETEAFVEALQLSFPVRVVERDRDRIVLGYRG